MWNFYIGASPAGGCSIYSLAPHNMFVTYYYIIIIHHNYYYYYYLGVITFIISAITIIIY